MAINYFKDSDCVGCETCRNCGRKNGYWDADLICDNCKESVEELWNVDGDELCEECLKASFEKKTYEQVIEQKESEEEWN